MGKISKNSSIGGLVRKAESDYISGTTTVSKYVDFSLSDDVNKIYAYLESKHTSGETDSQGREKPFFNIVLAARNIWFRSSDIDRSKIKVKASYSKEVIPAFFATIHLQKWMRRENFGTFLNSWGINSAGFNESIVEFVEQDGRLIPSVLPWNRIICDSVDFKNNPKIKVLEFTEAQLRKNKSYDQDLVEKLFSARRARETLDKRRKDNKNYYIKVYEIHGELPLSYLTNRESDEDTYVQQMQVITYLASKEKGNFDDYTLYSGKEEKDPQMLTALLPEIDGSIALRGSVKSLFEAQWMVNHTAKNIKDQLDLASKLIFQTSDGNFVGQNALVAIEQGDILIHAINQPITQVANNSHDISALQSFGQDWRGVGREIVGISESMLGQAAPSGTAWRQVEALLNENHSLFEIMTENKGLSIEQMMREYIIPFLKKKMDNSKEITATLEDHDITKIDSLYIKSESTKRANEMMIQNLKKLKFGDPIPTAQDHQNLVNANASVIQEGLSAQGNQRFFKPSDIPEKTWKELLKDIEWDLEIDVTGEDVDKEALTTLNTMLVTIANNPNILQDPNMKMIFNKILSLTGAVSPIEISNIAQPSPMQITPPAATPTVGG